MPHDFFRHPYLFNEEEFMKQTCLRRYMFTLEIKMLKTMMYELNKITLNESNDNNDYCKNSYKRNQKSEIDCYTSNVCSDRLQVRPSDIN